ncbi:hypothetical protein Q5530_26935 [Saccharothrix sp. BKS2]|uniref:hypothetical protein n=1 Tax=Saccharothrix sp. BKS2 TaxID=3064400 RepID=UPI0039EC732D
MSEERTQAPTWQAAADTPRDHYGNGPTWSPAHAARSLRRINEAGGPAEATAQAAAETVMVLHSIRRILIWTAVIIPAVLAVITITLMGAASA